MKQYDPQKPLISIHVPKCGGRSFELVLRNWFADKFYEHYFDVLNNKMPVKHKLEPSICIHGHFNKVRHFGIQDYYPEVDQFITILRDPFEMVLSNYFYRKRQAKSRWLNQFRIRGFWRIKNRFVLLDKFLQRYRENLLNHLPYAWTQDSSDVAAQPTNIDDYFKQQRSYLLNHMPYEMTLDNYKEIFEKYFIHVGVAEDLQTSVDIIATKLGFETVSVGHRNISRRDEEVSPEIRERFIENHPFDYAIYHYAREKYKHLK